jgi:hypothetical protein
VHLIRLLALECEMNRPIAGKERRTFRLAMLLEPREVQELDEYRYSSHIPSRAEAIRTLVQIGLKTVREKKEGSQQ